MKKMSEERKGTMSVLRRSVDNIKKRKKAFNFIRIQPSELVQKTKPEEIQRGKTEYSRGMVYLSHIPPGFCEEPMRNYFSQFGEVTNVKLARCEKTGRSKGYAFIEFQYAEVAKVAAETMNNYILFDRILKAEFSSKRFSRTFWNQRFDTTNYPKSYRVRENASKVNKIYSPKRDQKRLRRRLNNLQVMIQKLQAKGIDYNYKPAIRKEIADSPSTDGKYVHLDESVAPMLDSPCPDGKYVRPHTITPVLDSPCTKGEFETVTPVLEIDESDKEIEFMTPPNVIKKKLSVSKDLNKKSPRRKPNTKRQGKIKKDQRQKLETTKLPLKVLIPKKQGNKRVRSENVTTISANKLQEIEDTPMKKEATPNAAVKVTPVGKMGSQFFSQKLKSLSQGKRSKKQKLKQEKTK